MKFQDLPPEVQVIAAQTLSGKLCQSGISVAGKTEPATELAREVRNAFIELYSLSDEGAVKSDSESADLLVAVPLNFVSALITSSKDPLVHAFGFQRLRELATTA